MEKELTLREVFMMFQQLTNIINKNYKGVKFNYALSKTISKLDRELEEVRKVAKPSPQYEAYQQRIAIARSKGDEEEIKKIEEEFKEVKEEYEKQMKEVDQMMDETKVKIDIHQINLKDIPEDIEGKDLLYLEYNGFILED